MRCPNCGMEIGKPGEQESYIPPEYKPIGMWGYFGYELLFSIPCIGLILLIVFSFSKSNVNLKNFARSYFCLLILLVIVLLLIFGIAGGAAIFS